MYENDDDPLLRRSDLRRLYWHYWRIFLIVGLCVSCGALAWFLVTTSHFVSTHGGPSFQATSTAEAQQNNMVATRINAPSSGALAVAQRYYAAIRSQDYAEAYTNLTANATYNGKSISQAAFIQQAKALDKKDGIVTHFTVRGNSVDPDTVEVQVTRQHGRSYSVSLECVPDDFGNLDGTWHIVSFNEI